MAAEEAAWDAGPQAAAEQDTAYPDVPIIWEEPADMSEKTREQQLEAQLTYARKGRSAAFDKVKMLEDENARLRAAIWDAQKALNGVKL
jgi:hypothetical protein